MVVLRNIVQLWLPVGTGRPAVVALGFVKGNAIHTFVILRNGFEPSDALAEELRMHVGKEMGPIARPEAVNFVPGLPKTRSGKIMRRVLKARALGLPEGDISTLEA